MKKFRFTTLIILNAYPSILNAQNLIYNGSFEDTVTCINYSGGPDEPCLGWYEAIASPDYFSSVYDSSCGYTAVPQNIVGFQYPHTDNAYEGLATYVSVSPDRREYLGGRLVSSLIAGHTYCVNFYVSPANYCRYVIDVIGAYFSIDSVFDPNSNTVLPLVPQVESPAGVFLNDTLNWILISGSFIAQGGEKYVCIGNFRNDANTMLDTIGNATFSYASYYFIDDVSIVDCTVGINEIRNNSSFILQPNPAASEITLSYKLKNAEVASLIIYDLAGKEIKTQKLYSQKNSERINIESMLPGIYFVKIFIQNQLKFCEKIVVVK